ncbi:hypothetical protein VSQ48_08580 [Candidatus Ventrimonas sp. KK005]
MAENYVVSDGFTLDSGFQAARNLLEQRGMAAKEVRLGCQVVKGSGGGEGGVGN